MLLKVCNHDSQHFSTSAPPAKPTPSEHLQQLTLTHMPHYADNWREAPLHTSLHMKTKVSDWEILVLF